MKKQYTLILCLLLVITLLAGCVGTTVIIQECTCDHCANAPDSTDTTDTTEKETQASAPDVIKTGLAIVADAKDSESAAKAAYNVSIVAVMVDGNGVILDCIIDSVAPKVSFNANGKITSDPTEQISTKNELGDSYGMVQNGNAIAEWYQQAQALADFAKGKTVLQLKEGAIDASGKAPAGSDLASCATIYLGGYVHAIETAVNHAKDLGAQRDDTLHLAINNSTSNSTAATAEEAGNIQLDCDAVALTSREGVITSCYLDSVQAKVGFDTTGKITTDTASIFSTKNQLGDKYGMVQFGNAQFEWNQQAANFAKYVTGKTPQQVAEIAVTQGKPSGADLSASVTISIGGFQALIAKAMPS